MAKGYGAYEPGDQEPEPRQWNDRVSPEYYEGVSPSEVENMIWNNRIRKDRSNPAYGSYNEHTQDVDNLPK